MAVSLLAGDYDRILRCYAETVAVFLPGGIYRIAGEDDLRDALAEHRDGALSSGVKGLTARIAATGLPRGQKARMFVDWHYDMGPGAEERTASAVYYISNRGVGPKIEMIEYRSIAFRRAVNWHKGRSLLRAQPMAVAVGE